jgi:hypothetical protein
MKEFLPLLITTSSKLLPVLSDGATELTGSNFEDVVMSSGKNSFIKFLAPW